MRNTQRILAVEGEVTTVIGSPCVTFDGGTSTPDGRAWREEKLISLKPADYRSASVIAQLVGTENIQIRIIQKKPFGGWEQLDDGNLMLPIEVV